MINYSRQDVQKQLIADQALWQRVPVAIAALIWPAEIIILGWHIGWWMGALTVIAVAFLSAAIPPRLKISVYLVDLLEQFVKLPLELCWLILSWHLWTREPIFPLLGQPLAGALVISALLWSATRLLSFTTRLMARQAFLGRRA